MLSCKRLPLSNHYHGHLWKSAIPYFIGLRLEQALSSVWRGKEGRGSDIGLGWRLGNIHIIGVQACRFFAFAFTGVIHRRSCSGTGSWISRGSKVLYNGSRRNYIHLDDAQHLKLYGRLEMGKRDSLACFSTWSKVFHISRDSVDMIKQDLDQLST